MIVGVSTLFQSSVTLIKRLFLSPEAVEIRDKVLVDAVLMHEEATNSAFK